MDTPETLRRSLALAPTLAAVAIAIAPTSTRAQMPGPCTDDPAYAAIDFWVGQWTVWVGEQQVGTNRIVKVQGGCAIEEHWVDVEGGTGQSLFFYLPAAETWKQVWVTPSARAPGGIKEKTRIAAPGDAVRFRGTITRPDATAYLDQTTLTPLDGGRVRQLIEVSFDGGTTWRPTFDAVYRPATPGDGASPPEHPTPTPEG